MLLQTGVIWHKNTRQSLQTNSQHMENGLQLGNVAHRYVLNATIWRRLWTTRWRNEKSIHNQKTNMMDDKLVLINNRSSYPHPITSVQVLPFLLVSPFLTFLLCGNKIIAIKLNNHNLNTVTKKINSTNIWSIYQSKLICIEYKKCCAYTE